LRAFLLYLIVMLHTNRFFDFFPPPQFLEMPAIGIDISGRSVRFAELKHKGGAFVLGRFGEKEIPPGVVVSGQIRKHEELRNVLAELKQEHDFTFVRISLPEEQGYSLKIQIPRVKPKEIYESLELQLQEHVPLAAQEAVFDYSLVACGEEMKDVYEIGLSVMPHKVIESYVRLFNGTGLIPLSFEFEAHAIARSVIKQGNCDAFILLDIGATRTGIAVQSQGVITFTSTINVGGHSLTESISNTLGISFEEAKQQKESRGLLDGKGDPLYQALISRLAVLRDEFNKHYTYIKTHKNITGKGENNVKRIVVCGGEANVPGFANYLAATLKTDIEIANPWTNVNSLTDYVPEIPSNHALRYVTALGLAQRSPL